MRYIRLILPGLFFAWLLTGIARIDARDRAVVRRFGRVVATSGPGLWLGWPWGIDRLDRVPLASVQTVRVGYRPFDEESLAAGQLLTGDQNLIDMAIAIDYSVGEGDDALVEYVLERERGETLLVREAESAMAEWIAGQSVDDVLLSGKATLPRWLSERLQPRIASQRVGIRIRQISVELLNPPENVRPAFEDVNRAQTAIRTQEFRGNREAEQLVKAARADAFRLKQEADSHAETQRTLARAEAEVFAKRLASYRALRQTNPDVLTMIWWDEMGKLLLAMKAKGRIDLLDNHIGADGLDVTQMLDRKK